MKNLFILSIFFTILFLVDCSNNESSINSNSITTDIDGEYQYSGYNLQNNLVSSGIIKTEVLNDSIFGTKNLTGTSWEKGQGTITGEITSGKEIILYINNDKIPQVILKGNFTGNNISGDRFIDTGGQPITQNVGKFLAIKL